MDVVWVGDKPLEDASLEMVMKNIYLQCDVNSSDEVPVSDLIQFIEPFMKHNLAELMELHVILDPKGTNPFISSDSFYRKMREWVLKLHRNATDNETNSEFNTSGFSTFNEMMNSSDISLYMTTIGKSDEFGASHNEDDMHNLIDQNCKLQEELKRLKDHVSALEFEREELKRIKDQMSTVEQEKLNLVADNDRLYKRLQMEQKIREQLQSERGDIELLKETSSAALKQIEELKVKYNGSKKENSLLKEKLSTTEVEKRELEDKCEYYKRTNANIQKTISELEVEIDATNSEIHQLEKHKEELSEKFKEQQQMCEYYKNANALLKEEKQHTELVLKKFLTGKENNISMSNIVGNSISLIDNTSVEEIVEESSKCSSLQSEILEVDNQTQKCETDTPKYTHGYCRELVKRLTYGEVQFKESKPTFAMKALRLMELDELSEKCAALMTDNKELKKENAEKYKTIIDLSEQAEKLRAKLNKVYAVQTTDSDMSHGDFVETAKEKSAKLEEHNSKLLEEIDAHKTKVCELEATIEDMRKANEAHQQKIVELTEKQANTEEQLKNLLSESLQIKDQNNSLQRKFEEAQKGLGAKTKETEQLRNKLQKLETTMQTFKAEITTRNQLIEKLQSDLKEANEDNETLRLRFAEKNTEFNALVKEVNTFKNQANALKEELKSVNGGLDELIASNDTLKRDLDDKIKECANLNMRLSAENKRYDSVRDELDCLKVEKGNYEESYKSLLVQYEKVKSVNENLGERTTFLEALLEKARQEKITLVDDCKKLHLELQKKESIITEIHNNLLSAKSSIAHLEKKSKVLKDELKKMNSAYERINELEKTNEDYLRQIEKKSVAYDEIYNKMAELSVEKELWCAERVQLEKFKEECSTKSTDCEDCEILKRKITTLFTYAVNDTSEDISHENNSLVSVNSSEVFSSDIEDSAKIPLLKSPAKENKVSELLLHLDVVREKLNEHKKRLENSTLSIVDCQYVQIHHNNNTSEIFGDKIKKKSLLECFCESAGDGNTCSSTYRCQKALSKFTACSHLRAKTDESAQNKGDASTLIHKVDDDDTLLKESVDVKELDGASECPFTNKTQNCHDDDEKTTNNIVRYVSFFFISIITLGVLYFGYKNNMRCPHSYPLTWATWEELLSPFIRRSVDGQPPY